MSAVAVYDGIEEWWGEDFDEDLAVRIADAPAKHLIAFSESFDFEWSDSLPDVPPGRLRPVVTSGSAETQIADQVSTALRLLLYAHEVVIDANDFDQVLRIGRDLLRDESGVRGEVRSSLVRMAHIRPLVADGSIRVNRLERRGRHPSRMGYSQTLYSDPALQEIIAELRELMEAGGLPADDNSVIGVLWMTFAQLTEACRLAAAGKGHALAQTAVDQAVVEAILGRQTIDGRHTLLNTLAALDVPNMHGRVADLVRFRTSVDAFAEWREGLSRALQYVDDLPEDDSSIYQASSIVSGELQNSIVELQRATNKSPVLLAAKGGVTGMAITGVSAATTGILTGNPWVALASGATGKLADSALAYLKAARQRRRGRLIVDFALAFDVDSTTYTVDGDKT